MHSTETWYVSHCGFLVLDNLFQVVFLFVGRGAGKDCRYKYFFLQKKFFLAGNEPWIYIFYFHTKCISDYALWKILLCHRN